MMYRHAYTWAGTSRNIVRHSVLSQAFFDDGADCGGGGAATRASEPIAGISPILVDALSSFAKVAIMACWN
jgi:hypothetical protein